MKRIIAKVIGAAILSISIAAGTGYQMHSSESVQGVGAEQDYGWKPPTGPVQEVYSDPPEIPSGRGEVRLLYKDWEKATGYAYDPRAQNAPDCVGQATAGGLDFRRATQSLEGPYLVPEREADASSIYGLSRVEIGDTNWSAGSTCRWAMEAMYEYGMLCRKDYIYAGYDLTQYDPSRSRTWGRQGLPTVLEKISRFTPVTEYYKVTNYEQVRDAIANGYPVVVGSNVGFSNRTFFSWGRTKATRDGEGFLRRRGVWKHAMVFVGVDDRSPRKGVCCLNSWGRGWVDGPRKLDQPAGSFWIDARTVTGMVSQGDAYAIVEVQSPLSYRLVQ